MNDLRTTTGQPLSIRFDPTTGLLTIREGDWFAEPLRSTGVPERDLPVRLAGVARPMTLPRARLRRTRIAA